jgi:hypothetical protein
LANPTGNLTPEIKKIVNQKYIKYFDGSYSGHGVTLVISTVFHNHDFEMSTKTWHGSRPNTHQASLCGKLIAGVDRDSVIEYHFKCTWLYLVPLLGAVVSTVLGIMVFSIPTHGPLDIVSLFGFLLITTILPIALILYFCKLMLDILKDLLETN